MALSARFFCNIAYIPRATSNKTTKALPIAIPIIAVELIEVPPCSAKTHTSKS